MPSEAFMKKARKILREKGANALIEEICESEEIDPKDIQALVAILMLEKSESRQPRRRPYIPVSWDNEM